MSLELRESEALIFRRRANRTVGRRARGGRLYLTDQRLVFEPSLLERLLSRKGFWEASLANVATVDVAPPGGGRFDGSAIRRLRIRQTDGLEELFVVVRPASVASEIAEAAAQEISQ